jgi:hypothetical protein
MIGTGCLAVLAALSHSPLIPSWSRHPVLHALFYVGLAVIFVSAAFALFGHNWARWLLVGWLGYNIGTSVLTHVSLNILCVRALALGVICYYLFQPAAQEFFEGGSAVNSNSNGQSPEAEPETGTSGINDPVSK